MSADLRAIEIYGTVDEEHRLHLDEDVPIGDPSRVRVIILVPGTSDDEVRAEQGDMDEPHGSAPRHATLHLTSSTTLRKIYTPSPMDARSIRALGV